MSTISKSMDQKGLYLCVQLVKLSSRLTASHVLFGEMGVAQFDPCSCNNVLPTGIKFLIQDSSIYNSRNSRLMDPSNYFLFHGMYCTGSLMVAPQLTI